MDTFNVDDDLVLADIGAARDLLERIGIEIISGCPCGCIGLTSKRTAKAQHYGYVDDMTYLSVLGFAGPAFRQIVVNDTVATGAGQTTWECFLMAVAIVRSCQSSVCISDNTNEQQEDGERGYFFDADSPD
jgi:hypothetical protein